jgi:PKD repeat protein
MGTVVADTIVLHANHARGVKGNRMQRIASALWLAAMLLATASAQDLTTANTNSLSHFWAIAQATNRPVTVVSFGDSMADSYDSVTFSVMNMLVESLGIAGYSLNNYRNATLGNVTNGAQAITGPTPIWFTDYWEVPPGGTLWFEDQSSPNGVYSDKLGVFWVAQPLGGQMTFSVSTDQGTWTPLITLNGFASVATGQYTNVVLAADFHRIRVDGVTGTNYIIGPQLLFQATSGVQVAFMDKAAIAIGDVTNVPSAIRAPILAALSPDLLIWHMKEDSTIVTSNGLITCEQWWSNAAPACDVIYIGTPYSAFDTNAATAITVSQNTLVRYTALQHNRAYCDLMNPSISFPWMNSQGYMSDAVHVTYAGGLYLARYLWYEFGFSAIGTGISPQTVSFTASPTNGVVPLSVTFLDTSVASVTNWFWNFGDGNITNLVAKVVRHTYASTGTYTVTETVNVPGGSLTNTQANYITVALPPPIVSFSAGPTFGVAPLIVTFTDTSTGNITNWFWDFGDGTTTNLAFPSVGHSYLAAGDYTVTETVTGLGGSSTTTRAHSVTVLTPQEASLFQVWLTQYFNCSNCLQALMYADADGTGQHNFFKYTAGLDPTNPASVFVIKPSRIQNLPGQFSFQFTPVVAGRIYAPHYSLDPGSGVWQSLTNYAGPVTNGDEVTVTDLSATNQSKYYRIDISLP